MTVDPIVMLLRAERIARGISQRQLAERAGILQSMISEWESGKVSPTLESLRRLAGALGADLTASKRLGR